MICPHDHQECDNRGCRYGGCQGRPSRELVAHRDPASGRTSLSKARMAEPCQLPSLISQQFPGRAPESNYVTEGCHDTLSKFGASEGGAVVPTTGRVWASILD
jgi:hypothetical protein